MSLVSIKRLYGAAGKNTGFDDSRRKEEALYSLAVFLKIGTNRDLRK
jgi:hypothetical protein